MATLLASDVNGCVDAEEADGDLRLTSLFGFGVDEIACFLAVKNALSSSTFMSVSLLMVVS